MVARKLTRAVWIQVSVITFYQQQMPLDGWNPFVSLVTGGGLLVYTRTNQSVLISIGKSNGKTTLAIMVGTTNP